MVGFLLSLILFFLLCDWFFVYLLFFFNDPAPTGIYTLSLHDALPISARMDGRRTQYHLRQIPASGRQRREAGIDRKSTRLNSSHANISYAVFCLKKKKSTNNSTKLHVTGQMTAQRVETKRD